MSQDRYNKVLMSARSEYRGLGVSAQKAYREVGKLATATKLASTAQTKEIALNKQYAAARREATAANARHTADTTRSNAVAAQAIATEERLKNKFVQGYAAMDVYTKELNDLSMARKANIISTEQQTAAVERLNMQMSKGTGAFRGYSGGVVQAGRSTNQLGVVAQQTGYQVGDFLVQIQSGANPMMAFGQQATQLVGVLPLLSDSLGISAGKLMGISAVLGIAIPLVTAIAGYMLRSGKAAREASDEQDGLQESLEGTVESLEDANRAWEDFRQGLLKGESGFTDSIESVTQRLLDAKNALENESSLDLTSRAILAPFFNMGDVGNAGVSDAQKAVDEAQRLYDKFLGEAGERAAQRATDRESEAVNRIALLATEIAFGEDSLAVATELTRQAEEAYRIELARDGIKDSTEADNLVALMLEIRRLDAAKESKEIKEEDLTTAEEMLSTLMNEAKVQSLINRYGEDSAKVSAERVEQERQAFAILVGNLDVQQSIKDTLNEAYNETVDLAASGAAWADRMADVGAEVKGIMASLASLGGGMLDNAFKQVELDVLEAGGTNLAAGRAADRARVEAEFAARSVGANPFELAQIGAERGSYNLGLELDDDILARQQANNDNDRGSSGGGSGSKSGDKPDFVEALRAEMVVREQLVKLYVMSTSYSQRLLGLSKVLARTQVITMLKLLKH
jgi:hypothetical protein